MRIDHVVYMLVIVVGTALAWNVLRSRWPGWKALPLLLIVIQVTNDLGVTPLLFDLSGYEYRAVKPYTRTYGWEAFYAGGLILLCYVMIGAGLVSVRLLPNRAVKSGPCDINEVFSPHLAKRAWLVSLFLFALGSVANVVILKLLLDTQDILMIAFERALYTDANLVESGAYHMLRQLASMMLIGALGMVFFSAGRPWNRDYLFLPFLQRRGWTDSGAFGSRLSGGVRGYHGSTSLCPVRLSLCRWCRENQSLPRLANSIDWLLSD